ncbi:uncharacterized protein LOC135260058 [Anguilla rostrata]|uniref:uncharacterized protein LOC135260058 n=1 Tax=Anguilla rostrata TaxID=7938 RepID=UPI0030CD7731
MKCIIFIVLAATILHVSMCSKLALITGLNGGLVAGLNPGLILGGVNPGLAVGGINPLIAGGGVIAQPPFAQVLPGVPTYLQSPFVPRFGYPQLGYPQMGYPQLGYPQLGYPQQQQFPRQPGFPANGGSVPPNNFGVQQGVRPGQQQGMGQPYYMGVQPQNPMGTPQGVNPIQQQVMETTGRPWNGNQQPGPAETGPIRRYRRALPLKFPGRACARARNEDPSEIAPTPAPTELQPVPRLLKMD